MSKYQTLLKILERIRQEAPKTHKKYWPPAADVEKTNQANARAYIHLYLKVKFGLTSFLDRESKITDAGEDGGIDAYYIDKDNKVVHIIQSKFRTNEKNYEEKEISDVEILKIEIDRIVRGEVASEAGVSYNGKIKALQKDLENTEHLGQYKYRLVFLANHKNKTLLEKLYKDYQVDLFDFERSYKELVFPVASGTYFRADSLHIKIDLDNTSSGHSRVSYTASIDGTEADVTLLFAPTKEIGRILSKYRNSLLKYNPRSFLGLKDNSVNSEIREAITSTRDNRFALFNNGLTIVGDEAGYSDKTGKKNTAHLDIKNPQIINGGQTAYTLSAIYDELSEKGDLSPFDGKEVLLKIITIDPENSKPENTHSIIEKISRSTNLQTRIEEADRRSNDLIQTQLQLELFEKFGLFYERKAGEFYDGLSLKYIDKENIVDREQLLRVALAVYFNLSATKTSISSHFSASEFSNGALASASIDKLVLGYSYHQEINKYLADLRKTDRSDRYGTAKYGQALRYGRFAVLCVAANLPSKNETPRAALVSTLEKWRDFEQWLENTKNKYFQNGKKDYVGYYKGDTIDSDVKNYFFTSKLS